MLHEHPALRTGLLVLGALALGLVAGAMVTLAPVWVGFAALVALVGGYAMLRSALVSLAAVFAVITLLPFGTLPFKAAFTPTFLELTLVVLIAVWGLRQLAIPEYELRISPLGGPVLIFLGLTIFSLLLGANGLPDNLTLHNYLKFVLGVLLFFSVLNTVRTPADLRCALRALIIGGASAAALGIVLRQINPQTALRILVAFGRVGYPTSGRVLRYIEDDPARAERAIGLSVDPNSFAGLLALLCALSVSQLWARRPVLPRWTIALSTLLLAVCTVLTQSRGALYGLLAATIWLALVRDRRIWWLLLGGALFVVLDTVAGLGIVSRVIDIKRFVQGVQFQDLAQQMRLAEYRNAIAIILRYPVFGVGFGAGPELGLITGVSSIYLAIAERIGLVGLASFAVIMLTFFVITLRRARSLPEEPRSVLVGVQAGIVAALTVGIADHYFFNIEFAHMVALFWGVVALGMAALYTSQAPATPPSPPLPTWERGSGGLTKEPQ